MGGHTLVYITGWVSLVSGCWQLVCVDALWSICTWMWVLFLHTNQLMVCCCCCCCCQSVYEDVARDTNRGHTVEAVKECFCQAKDAGFKVKQRQLPLTGHVSL
jgi:hypothetical protein